MQSSEKYEKSRGLIAFALNTDTTDYQLIAQHTVSLASQKLNLPATIITNEQIQDLGFTNNRFDRDQQQFVNWRNVGRHLAYQLSPYQETLVIDVDYVVLDSALATVFDTQFDYLLTKSAMMLNGEPLNPNMGRYSLPYVWATVFAFRKTQRAKLFFDLVERIQTNYAYYRDLFNIEARNFRNDYAFAIADVILNGHAMTKCGFPGTLVNVPQTLTHIGAQDDFLVVKDSCRSYVVPRMNLHIMSKQYLQSKQFLDFVNESA